MRVVVGGRARPGAPYEAQCAECGQEVWLTPKRERLRRKGARVLCRTCRDREDRERLRRSALQGVVSHLLAERFHSGHDIAYWTEVEAGKGQVFFGFTLASTYIPLCVEVVRALLVLAEQGVISTEPERLRELLREMGTTEVPEPFRNALEVPDGEGDAPGPGHPGAG